MFGPIKIDINCQCLAPEDGEIIQFSALKNLKTGAELLEERRGRLWSRLGIVISYNIL